MQNNNNINWYLNIGTGDILNNKQLKGTKINIASLMCLTEINGFLLHDEHIIGEVIEDRVKYQFDNVAAYL